MPGDLDAYSEYGRTAGKECRNVDPRRFVGRLHDSAATAEARSASGAAIVRVVRSGDIVTAEFRYDRLNIDLDREGRIVSLRCG